MVITTAEHACDHVLKGVLKPLTYRLQIFFVKYGCLRSLQPREDKGVTGKVKKKNVFATLCFRSLRLIWRPALRTSETSHDQSEPITSVHVNLSLILKVD